VLPVVQFVRLLRGDRCRGHFPDLFLPLAEILGQNQGRLWMGRVALKADDLGDDSYLLFRILGDRQAHLAADKRKQPGQVDQGTLRPDVLGQAFLDDLLPALVSPSCANGKRHDVTFT